MDETNYYFSFLLITIKEKSRLQRPGAKMFFLTNPYLNETGAPARQGLKEKLFAPAVDCTQFEE